MKRHESIGDRILVGIVYLFVTGLIIVTLYPFWDLAVLSISPRAEALNAGLRLFTLKPTFSSYQQVFNSPEIWRSFLNSVIRTVSATVLSVVVTSLTAYPLSKKYLPLNKFFTGVVLFTMIFSGGLIPTYLLIKSLHLLDSWLVLILPGAVGAYNLIIMRNFLRFLPESLEESAKIDGAKEFGVWWRIILPLSTPVLATVSLWVAVANWNAYFDALIYITDRGKYVLPILLRRLLLENQMDMYMPGQMDTSGLIKPTEETLKAAIIIVSTLPIMLVYPFLQKHFAKGIMLGAVKG